MDEVSDTGATRAATGGDGRVPPASGVRSAGLGAFERRKTDVADRVDELVDAVRAPARRLSGRQDWIAGALTGGADELARFAQALRQAQPADIVAQARALGRQRPALFAGAALAAGFAIARVVRIAAAAPADDVARREAAYGAA